MITAMHQNIAEQTDIRFSGQAGKTRSTRKIIYNETYYSDIEATLKWFDAKKGFGFVEPCDGSSDAFLSARILRDAGYQTLANGTTLFCKIVPGETGLQVAKILHIDAVTGTGIRLGAPLPQDKPASKPAKPNSRNNRPKKQAGKA